MRLGKHQCHQGKHAYHFDHGKHAQRDGAISFVHEFAEHRSEACHADGETGGAQAGDGGAVTRAYEQHQHDGHHAYG